MQNLSVRAIITRFLENPSDRYVNKNSPLQFNDNVLFSHSMPIAMYDQATDTFICRYYPVSNSGWLTRHLLEFQQKWPKAVRLPKLDATLSETVTFYEAELARFSPIAKTHAEISVHYAVAKEYFASVGVRMPASAEPLSRDTKLLQQASLKELKADAMRASYEAVIFYYTKYPGEYSFYGRLGVKAGTFTLAYSGTTLAKFYPEHELFAIRAYDLRPKQQSLIQQLIMHTTPSLTNLSRHILVPEVDTSLSDTTTMLAKYAQRLEDLAFNVALYQRDTPAPRAVARAYSQLAKSRQNYIDMMHIPDINLPTYTPDATTHAALKKYGAYREDNG